MLQEVKVWAVHEGHGIWDAAWCPCGSPGVPTVFIAEVSGPFRKQCQCVVNTLVVWELYC